MMCEEEETSDLVHLLTGKTYVMGCSGAREPENNLFGNTVDSSHRRLFRSVSTPTVYSAHTPLAISQAHHLYTRSSMAPSTTSTADNPEPPSNTSLPEGTEPLATSSPSVAPLIEPAVVLRRKRCYESGSKLSEEADEVALLEEAAKSRAHQESEALYHLSITKLLEGAAGVVPAAATGRASPSPSSRSCGGVVCNSGITLSPVRREPSLQRSVLIRNTMKQLQVQLSAVSIRPRKRCHLDFSSSSPPTMVGGTAATTLAERACPSVSEGLTDTCGASALPATTDFCDSRCDRVDFEMDTTAQSSHVKMVKFSNKEPCSLNTSDALNNNTQAVASIAVSGNGDSGLLSNTSDGSTVTKLTNGGEHNVTISCVKTDDETPECTCSFSGYLKDDHYNIFAQSSLFGDSISSQEQRLDADAAAVMVASHFCDIDPEILADLDEILGTAVSTAGAVMSSTGKGVTAGGMGSLHGLTSQSGGGIPGGMVLDSSVDMDLSCSKEHNFHLHQHHHGAPDDLDSILQALHVVGM